MKQNNQELWNNYKDITGVSGLPEEKEWEKEAEIISKAMTENFQKLMIDIKPQIQETEIMPRIINRKIYTYVYYIQNEENQREWENLEKSQREKTLYL